jgi:hypothetical protein
MIIREMEQEGEDEDEDEDHMNKAYDSDENGNTSDIDFTEVDALYRSDDCKPTATSLPPVVLFSTSATTEPSCVSTISTVPSLSTPAIAAVAKEEKVLFSTVSQTKPISVSLDISSC